MITHQFLTFEMTSDSFHAS